MQMTIMCKFNFFTMQYRHFSHKNFNYVEECLNKSSNPHHTIHEARIPNWNVCKNVEWRKKNRATMHRYFIIIVQHIIVIFLFSYFEYIGPTQSTMGQTQNRNLVFRVKYYFIDSVTNDGRYFLIDKTKIFKYECERTLNEKLFCH